MSNQANISPSAATWEGQGFALLFSGILVTSLPMLAGTVICRRFLRLPLLRLLGVITGAMTSTPGLARCAFVC